jgi:hypothetical protein
MNAPPRIGTKYAYPVDVVRELSPLILVNGMADVCIGALHGDLASPGGDGRCLRAELNIELSDVDCVSCERQPSQEKGDDALRPNLPARPCHWHPQRRA